jgi:hypothetical protein
MSLFRLEEVCWLTYKDVTVYCEIWNANVRAVSHFIS